MGAQDYEMAPLPTPDRRHGLSDMDLRLLEASPDCIKIIDANAFIRYINRNGRTLFELGDADVMEGRSWIDLWPDSERLIAAAALEEALRGSVGRFSAYCPTSKSTPKWWDVVISPVDAGDGNITTLLAVSRDVTHQKSIEQTLRTSEQHFRALANNIAQLAWMADKTGAVFWYNQRWFDFTGTTFNEMAGWGWKKVHHPDHLDRVVEKFTDCIDNGEEWEDVFPLRAADGAYRWFLSRAMPLRDAAGNIELWFGTNTDVTEQRNQSQRLRQLVRIIDLSHEAILVWDMEDGIVIWNRGCEDLYGFDKATAIGANSHRLLKTEHPMPQEEFERVLLSEGSWTGELLHRADDGSEVWVDSRQEVIRIGGRRLVLETNRDITDRRRADEVRNLLVAELNHRVKNTMAIIQSIATQTARNATSIDSFVESFNGRLQSLASAHNVLTDSDWSGASIKALVKLQLTAAGGDNRTTFNGDDIYLSPQTALQFTLILHELATNAVKHGALSVETGRIEISWAIVGDPPMLELVWREVGGPSVQPPKSRGFGLNLIERSSRLPNLKTKTDFASDGLVVHLTADLQQHGLPPQEEQLFNPGRKLMKLRTSPALPRGHLVRQRILIVEREPRDAMLLEDIMYDAGYATIGPVSTLDEVVRKLDLLACEIAIVDADGSRSEVSAIVEELASRRIPSLLIGSIRHLAASADLVQPLQKLSKPLEPRALLDAVAASISTRQKQR